MGGVDSSLLQAGLRLTGEQYGRTSFAAELRATVSTRTLQRRQMLRRQPGLPPVEVARRGQRGKTPHPRGIPAVLKGGAGAWADAARKAPAVPVAAKASGTLPTTVLAEMGFALETATYVRVATTTRRDHPGKGGKLNGATKTAPHTWETL
ncbi:hypothetical protein THAOC_20099 [Thalassiosira oceanica]|uniref:Uncharacterized protein n=1 Tax=Thalassiosira oceanica TaxID=159749 RepID=K0S492_THAOC|nr:hypothetical protein THAOC_20099 [Thalassiosira oceanica]|eukprot:EJK59644.1 hypothetical protein THAOC_20099 [Thalassiosira oceanica]